MTGVQFEPETCYFNRAVPGSSGCVSPCPEVLPQVASIWEVFQRSYASLGHRGMDGEPTGRDVRGMAKVAEALRVAWDERTLRLLQAIESEWRKGVDRQLKAREDERKRDRVKR